MPIITGYEYRQDGGSPVDIGLVDPLTFTVDSLTPDTLYSYEVRAYYDDASRSAWSNIATARTLGEFNGFGPLQWLKADHLSGLSDGNPITLWDDSSANNHDAISTDSPIYKTGILNGLPVARFNGTSNFLTLLAMPAWAAAEVMIVIKLVADPPATIPKTGLWTFAQGLANHYPYIDSHIYENFASTTRKDIGNPAANLAAWRIYGVYSAPNDWAAYFDGALFYHTSTNSVAVFSGNAALGKSVTAGITPYLNGDVAEYILWDRKLSDAERAAVVAYFQAKYGL